MKPEVKSIGYVRSSLYRKAIGLFGAERVVEISGIRRTMRMTTNKEVAAGVVREQYQHARYVFKWDRSEHSAKTYLPVSAINKVLRDYGLVDFIIARIVMETTCKHAVEMMNGELERRFREKHITDGTLLKPDIKLFVSFRDNSTPEATRLKYVDALNAQARAAMNAKVGVLDMVDVKTERHFKYGEAESWPLGEGPALVRALLRTLDFDGWPEADRILEHGGLKVIPRPAAIRNYARGKSDSWILQGEEEVNHERE